MGNHKKLPLEIYLQHQARLRPTTGVVSRTPSPVPLGRPRAENNGVLRRFRWKSLPMTPRKWPLGRSVGALLLILALTFALLYPGASPVSALLKLSKSSSGASPTGLTGSRTDEANEPESESVQPVEPRDSVEYGVVAASVTVTDQSRQTRKALLAEQCLRLERELAANGFLDQDPRLCYLGTDRTHLGLLVGRAIHKDDSTLLNLLSWLRARSEYREARMFRIDE